MGCCRPSSSATSPPASHRRFLPLWCLPPTPLPAPPPPHFPPPHLGPEQKLSDPLSHLWRYGKPAAGPACFWGRTSARRRTNDGRAWTEARGICPSGERGHGRGFLRPSGDCYTGPAASSAVAVAAFCAGSACDSSSMAGSCCCNCCSIHPGLRRHRRHRRHHAGSAPAESSPALDL